jgi:hypothetical protein
MPPLANHPESIVLPVRVGLAPILYRSSRMKHGLFQGYGMTAETSRPKLPYPLFGK